MASKFIITAAHCLYTDHCIRDKSMKCILRKPEQIEVYHVYMLTSTSVHVYKYMCTSTCVQCTCLQMLIYTYDVHIINCQIKIGDHVLSMKSNKEIVTKAQKIIIHKKYDTTKRGLHDLAIVKLKNEVDLNIFPPACLARASFNQQKYVIFTVRE